MKVTITGGCGFIGSHLVRRGIEERWEIVIYDNFSRFTPEHLPRHHELVSIVQGNIEDFEKVTETLRGSDVVFHLGGKSRAAGSIENPRGIFETNVLGTYNVFEACRGTSARIIFTSSWVVYSKDHIRFGVKTREGDRLGTTTPYGLSKLIGEEYAKLYNRLYNQDIVSVRLSNVYGPGDKDRVIPTMTSRAIKGEPIRVDGNPRYVNFIYIDDVVDALVSIAKYGNVKSRVYNIGTSESVDLKDLANIIIRECGSSSPIKIGPMPSYEYEYYCPNIDLARDELEFVPRVSIEKGIEECVKWVFRSPRGR